MPPSTPDDSTLPPEVLEARSLRVPRKAAGMRLDAFLSAWFFDWDPDALTGGVARGWVRGRDGTPLAPEHELSTGEWVDLWIPGLAPTEPPPRLPTILHEDDRVVAVDKPAGMLAHPSGRRFVYALIGLAKARWPDARMDLCHRLDRDTSGVLLLTKDVEANRFVKKALHDGACTKVYQALCKGHLSGDHHEVREPLGPDGGEIRIKQACREDGLSAHTTVEVEARHATAALTRVRCTLHSGRTHQIRVHLDHLGHPLLGDRLYGVPPDVFLESIRPDPTSRVVELAGAPRQALHAARLRFPHPDGGEVEVESPLPSDLTAWWEDPALLPLGIRDGNL